MALEPLTVEEMDQFQDQDTLTREELNSLIARAQAEPDAWRAPQMSIGGMTSSPEPWTPAAQHFEHILTAKKYVFGYAPANDVWFLQV